MACQGQGWRTHFFHGRRQRARSCGDLRKRIDFVADCRKLYAGAPREIVDPNNPNNRFAQMRRDAVGLADDSDLIVAAWLYRWVKRTWRPRH